MALSVLQGWLLIGVPTLVLGLWLYTASSRWTAYASVAVFLVGFGLMVTVDIASAAALAGVLSLLYAAGPQGRGAARGRDPVRDERVARRST